MKVKELKDKTKVDEITLKITKKEEPREIRDNLRVCNLEGEDDTGKITITLWNDDIDKVEINQTIKITNGWCQIYNENLQVSPGRFGKMEVLED